MKTILLTAAFIAITIFSCRKNKDCNCSLLHSCATVVQVASLCDNFGILINGREYPAANIPSQYQVTGMKVCVRYELYEDMRLCLCCGGTWADIISIKAVE